MVYTVVSKNTTFGFTGSSPVRATNLSHLISMSRSQLIEKLITDSNYKILKNGDIHTCRDRSGVVSSPKKWRLCVNYKRNCPPSVHYYYNNLQVHRIIYWKFKGPISENNIIVHKDGNNNNNSISNLEKINKIKLMTNNHKNRDNYYKSVEKKRNLRIDRISKILEKEGYEWVNVSEYSGTTKSLCKVRCNNGHIFSIHNQSILRNVKCSVCFQNLFIGETICRVVLESLIGCSFNKTRSIPGLISPKTGRFLEIDGFNEGLNIGFEYQGGQHTNFHKFIHKKRKHFEYTQYKDEIKVNFFKDKGWPLIVVDQFKRYETKFVIQQIKSILEDKFKFIKILPVDEKQINESIKQEINNSYTKPIGSEKRVLINNPEYKKKVMKFFKKIGATLIEGLFNSKRSLLIVRTKQNKIVKISVSAIFNIIDNNIVDNSLTHENLKEEKKQRIIQRAKEFKYFTIFKKAHPECSAWIIRNHYTNQLRAVFGLAPSESKRTRKYTDEYLINEAKKFKTRGKMYHEGRNAYELILLRKLQTLAFAHMIKPSRKKSK